MIPRSEPSCGLLRPLAHPGLTIMGDPEDDEDEEEEEKKKGEDDEEEEGNDGEEDEVPWKVGTHSITNKMRASPFFHGVVYWSRHAPSA